MYTVYCMSSQQDFCVIWRVFITMIDDERKNLKISKKNGKGFASVSLIKKAYYDNSYM